MSGPFTGPTALYNNLPIHTEYYQPRLYFITGILLGKTTIVAMSANHDYVIGQLVRLLIPNGFGSRELNEREGFVISIPQLNQVEINIDSQKVNPFINANLATKPQILGIGDVNTGYISSTGPVVLHTEIPGSFINISP